MKTVLTFTYRFLGIDSLFEKITRVFNLNNIITICKIFILIVLLICIGIVTMYTQDKTLIKTLSTELNGISFSLAGLWHMTLLFGVLALVGVTVCFCQISLLIAIVCCLLVLFALGSIVVAAPSYLKARAKYYWSLAKSETK